MAGKPYTQDLSVGPLSQQFNFVGVKRLNQVMVNFNVPITETVTVTLVSRFGSAFNNILDRATLKDKNSYSYIPDRRPYLGEGDSLLIECTNANTTGVASGTYEVESWGS